MWDNSYKRRLWERKWFSLARSKFSRLGKTANCHGLAINPSIRLLCRNFMSRSFHEILFSEQRKIDFFSENNFVINYEIPKPIQSVFYRLFVQPLLRGLAISNHFFPLRF